MSRQVNPSNFELYSRFSRSPPLTLISPPTSDPLLFRDRALLLYVLAAQTTRRDPHGLRRLGAWAREPHWIATRTPVGGIKRTTGRCKT